MIYITENPRAMLSGITPFQSVARSAFISANSTMAYYIYETTISKIIVQHFYKLGETIIDYYKVTHSDIVLEKTE